MKTSNRARTTAMQSISTVSMVLGALGVAATGCGGGSATQPGPNGGGATATGTEVAPYKAPTPAEESARTLKEARDAPDPKERCAKLQEAVLLDGTSYEAHLLRAESRCAAAKELLADARAALEIKNEMRSANALLAVGVRAESLPDAVRGSEALLEVAGEEDIDALRLAARTLARFGKYARAAKVFDQIAKARGKKSASLDALDARLDAVISTIKSDSKAGGKVGTADPTPALLSAIDAAGGEIGGYGAAWLGPKIIEAIATLRTSGDEYGADQAVAKVRAIRALASPDVLTALDLEQTIAALRHGDEKVKAKPAMIAAEHLAARDGSTLSRAFLAVQARSVGNCGDARSYARAYALLPIETVPRLDDDIAWALDCKGGVDLPSIQPPTASSSVQDAAVVAGVDRTRGRALLQKMIDESPDDVATYLALGSLVPTDERVATFDLALSRAPSSLALHVARFEALEDGPSREAEGKLIVMTLLPATIEIRDDPRAAAPTLARMVAASGPTATSASKEELATALFKACITDSLGAASCVDKPQADAVADAAHWLRSSAPDVLAKLGPRLATADLSPEVRLDTILALIDRKQVPAADQLAGASRGAWEGAEESLARAAIMATQKLCPAAKRNLDKAVGLPAIYDPAIAAVKKKCGF